MWKLRMSLCVWFRSLQIMGRNYFFVSFGHINRKKRTRDTHHPHRTHHCAIAVVTSLTNSFPLYATVCRRCRLRNCSKKIIIIVRFQWMHFIKLHYELLGQSIAHFILNHIRYLNHQLFLNLCWSILWVAFGMLKISDISWFAYGLAFLCIKLTNQWEGKVCL